MKGVFPKENRKTCFLLVDKSNLKHANLRKSFSVIYVSGTSITDVFLATSSIVTNMPTRSSLSVEKTTSFGP